MIAAFEEWCNACGVCHILGEHTIIYKIKDIKKMKKLLDLSETCVKTLSKRAIDENTNFKLLAQAILEREATSNSFEKTAVRGTKKNKNK